MSVRIFPYNSSRIPQRERANGFAVGCIGLLTLPVLAGCGAAPLMVTVNEGGAPVQGHVLGGQQPVAGATIELYAAGTAGNGLGATNLLAANAVATDSLGGFNIAGDYVCPTAGTQVYVIAKGGIPGNGSKTSNAALTMMAALGNCGDLTASSQIEIDEVTTVAAVWALQQFMSSGGIIGASATNSKGLANAFAIAKSLADTSAGSVPESGLPAGATMETSKLYTLANALSACVDSDGGSACNSLFGAALIAGGANGNTLDAALDIVTHPGRNVAAVFGAAPAPGLFQPELATAPNDWTMSITYGGCVATCGGLNLPGAVAVDSGGNVLVANYFGGVVSKFSPTGVPAIATGISGTGLHESFGVAIDASDDVWVTNELSVTGANNQHHGSVSEFSSSGLELSGYGYTGGGTYYPVAVATDPDGDVWVADYGSSSATLLANDGSAISGGGGDAVSDLPFTSAVAVDASHNAWFAAQNEVVRVASAGVVSSFPCCNDPAGIAVDAKGNVWVADYNASAVVELSSSGTVTQRTTILADSGGPKGIAVDGTGNVWAANYFGDALIELAGTTAAVISPALGYGLDAALAEPYGLAIDASGNVWVSNASANTLTQFVGLAGPVRTPLLGPVVQP